MPVKVKVNKWELIASICKESLVEFVRRAWKFVPGAGKLRWNWHLDVFCIELQRIAERVFQGLPKEYDLVLNVSPGTSKSTIWSILFPAWVWTRMPHARIMTASHTDTLATDLAGKSREVLKSEWYRRCYPHIRFRKDQDSKHYYCNTFGGDRFSCTVGGKAPMGFHAHICIVDDPIDPQKTASEVELEEAAKFMIEVIPTRKVDKLVTVTVLIMQRLDFRDPTAAVLDQAKKEGADPVRHICLPAELTDDLSPIEEKYEINGYKKTLKQMYGEGGGLMDSHRLSEIALRPYKARGAYYYATQFLQKPIPPGGGMFKRHYFDKRVKAAPHNAIRVWFWDRAATEEGGCYTAGVLLAMVRDPLSFYVEYVVHGQWEPVERNRIMNTHANRTRARYGPKNSPRILIEREGGSSGRDAWLMVVRALVGHVVEEITVEGSKDTRAEPWSSQLAAGNVFIVDNGESVGTGKAEWDVEGYIREHELFRPMPGKRLGKFKDQVDSSSGAFNYLIGSPIHLGFRNLPTGRKKGQLRIIVVNRNELRDMLVEEDKALLINLADPMIKDVAGHCINKLLDRLQLSFADIQPSEYQDKWKDPIAPYGELPEELIIKPEYGKKIWAFLKKQRADQPQVYVIQDEGERKALSVAMAVVDCYSMKRNEVIYILNEPDRKIEEKEKPPNQHIYDIVKMARSSVI